ncbi:MAG: S-methyl-5-thioribose-1-phosphate isomerase [bacterium]|jgi:methylthioribose-1-phosphate isomerase
MQSIAWKQGKVEFIDQTKLPQSYTKITCTDYREIIHGIKTLQIRGAPAIGVAAAMAFVLAAYEYAGLPAKEFQAKMAQVYSELTASRPTAVNLFWALNNMVQVLQEYTNHDTTKAVFALEKEALKLAAADLDTNLQIGVNGSQIIGDNTRVLTHCNAGALATTGHGTALGVIRTGYKIGKIKQVFATETRPLLQGARLTTWELFHEGIPVTLITDSMAGYIMQLGMVDMVIVGADRIARNGDVANKIGTYNIAVLARENNIPVYVAAPLSTFDFTLSSGKDIPIEERDPQEVTHINGHPIAPAGIDVFNPAFDITPARYITGIITEKGLIQPPYLQSINILCGGNLKAECRKGGELINE